MSNTDTSRLNPEPDPDAKWPPCGMIFEFEQLDKALAFAAEVKRRLHLDSRVFDDAEAAARSHAFPWVQYPPVVHVDRSDEADWRRAIAVEGAIGKLAEEFGGKFVGT